jgi:hypothetical protein
MFDRSMRWCGAAAIAFAVPMAAGCRKEKTPKKPVETLFVGVAKAHAPPPLSNVKFGSSEKDARAALPELNVVDANDHAYSFAYHGSDKREVVSLQIVFESEAIRNKAIESLTKQWGDPILLRGESEETHERYWFDAKEALRARLQARTMAFEPYIPIEDVLGSMKESFGFEKRPLLGMTAAEVKANYAANVEDDVSGPTTTLYLLPTEFAFERTEVVLHLDDEERVDAFTLRLEHPTRPAFAKKLRALIDGRLGPPKELEDNDDIGARWRAPKRTITLHREMPGLFTLRVDPLAS